MGSKARRGWLPLVLFAAGALACATGSDRLEDRSTAPAVATDRLEVVAELDQPPGNVAVTSSGRVFITFHPNAKPELKLAELVDGEPVPYPDERSQKERWRTPLSVRVDRQGRLWVLDDARHALAGRPTLTAFDVATGRVVHEHRFRRREARVGSMLNDFQASPSGQTIYVADTSFIARKPALLVYDVEAQIATRRLQRHDSVRNGPYRVYVDGQRIEVAGTPLWFGVDTIALSRDGHWLYFAAVNSGTLYRIAAADLVDPSLDDEALARRVHAFAEITLSDGSSTDLDGGIYITDMERSAVHRVDPEGALETIVRDPDRLRWPDGLCFGPDGWLYITASALQDYVGQAGVRRHVRAHAPYHVLRVRPGFAAPAGH